MILTQLSDLHLVEDLTSLGSRRRGKTPLAKSHHLLTLSRLGAAVRKTHFDLLIVTGDLATDGSAGALRQARRFLEDEEVTPEQLAYVRPWARGKRHAPIRCIGAKDKLVVLPGNHDRYSWLPMQMQARSFEKEFPVPSNAGSYPYVYVHSPDGSDCPLIIVIFDSTKVSDRASLETIAMGQVKQEAMTYLVQTCTSIRDQRRATCSVTGKEHTLDDQEYFTIAALHHHPVIPSGKPTASRRTGVKAWLARKWQGFQDWVNKDFHAALVEMKDAEQFVTACTHAKVGLVIFGHQHLCYQDREGSTLYSCCPASTSLGESSEPWQQGSVDDQPGFLSYNFESGTLTGVSLHRFERGGFFEHEMDPTKWGQAE